MSLKVENLSFSYENGGRHVLTRISLKIEPGERVGLVAPSGYGKTTLCRLLAGYERPEAGTVEIDGIPIENIRGCMPVQLIWQHPEQAVNPRWRMRQVLSEGGQVDEESRGRLGIRSFPEANCSGFVLPERWRQIRGICWRMRLPRCLTQ